jgi:Ca2+-binding RTX toxin-like protein
MGAYTGAAATANAAGMTELQLAALASHAAKTKANGITGLALDLGAAAMTDAISAALLGKADAATVLATGASTAEVDSLAALAAHIAAGGISGLLPVTPAQLADVRGALAPKLAGGLTISVLGTAAADSIDLSTLVNAASAIGGAGDDTYVVDSLLHTITELGGGGTDTLQSSVSITLPAHVEVLSLTGSGNIDGTGLGGDDILYGNSGNNSLAGAAGNDTLHGGIGNDTLDGGTGSDSLVGGAGDDLYQIDDAGDTVVEIAAEGTDTVLASVSHTLSEHVEVLSLTGSSDINGTGSAGNDTVYGNSGANLLAGADGNDSLLGGAGNDTLEGGLGNDTLDGGTGSDSLAGGQGDDLYLVDDTADVVTETSGQGTDTVQSFVTYTLPVEVEVLSLMGGSDINGTGQGGGDILIGNAGNNELFGMGGNDRLEGGDGNDTLDGGAGQDLLDGGDGSDTFVFSSMGPMDTLVGFTGGEDKFSFNGSYFYGTPGPLSANHFVNLNGDTTTSDLWPYDQAAFWNSAALSGVSQGGPVFFVLSDNRLYYDDNGNDTAGGYVVIAEIQNGAGTIGYSDIVIE